MKDFLENLTGELTAQKIDYGDIRVVATKEETIIVRNGVVESITQTADIGFGVRILKDNGWGFSASCELTKAEGNKVIKEALTIAKSSAQIKGKRHQGQILSELPPQKGNYATKFAKDPFAIPLSEKIDLLMKSEEILRASPKVKISQATLSFRKMKKYFASTEGAWLEQEILISGGGIECYAFANGEMQRRSYPCAFGGNYAQKGYEFIEELELVRNAEQTREEALMLLAAEPCPQGKTTIIIGSNQLALQVHESIGHPTELDRVLGTEASYAGTSFVTLDKLGNFRYGSDKVQVYADATIEGGLGTFGFDDEGVEAQRFPIIKNGIFTNFLTSRDTAPLINQKSNACARAASWNRIPLIRMTNINLEPGTWRLEDLISDTKDGIYLETNRSWSIDDKRLNFQFGTEIAYKIENGKLTKIYKNPLYTGITPEFWQSCDAIADKESWILWGLPNCGKGEPGQIAYVGHGTAPARFRNVMVGAAR
uniref:TldD/PmbA family protein n=1 Tax=candidate division WOR-3 bacterium TaxID=2052148 RepID=A0A7C6EA64_UNCW3